MKRICFMLIGLLFPIVLVGQQTGAEKPEWTEGYFKEIENSYIEVVSAWDYNANEARKKAVNEIISRRSIATGTEANVTIKNDDVSISAGHDLIVKARIIDEYVDFSNNGYIVYLLVQTAKNPTFVYEPVKVSNDYGFSARVFVPGMAQIYKGQVVKGSLFIAGEVAAIGGVIAFESLRASYKSKIGRTHNTKLRQQYINKTNNMKNIRNGFIGGAVAIYVWNVIDGIVAKGKKHIVIGENQLHFTPYTTMQSAGLMMSFNF